MKTKFFGMFWAMLAVVVLTGCDNDDDDIRVSDVPKEVMNTFEAKFPNVSRAEWENKLGYYVADFWQEGMETQVWIDSKAEWKMTELDLGVNLQLLPEAVRNAFQSGQYANWRVDDIDKFEHQVDCIQVGARNMQNFDLLKEVGSMTQKPILLKRGMSATLQELLMSAEYIMASGNPNVILCERGIRTFETQLRNTLDLGVVPLLHRLSHLPVVVDPSHATGYAYMVDPVAVAATAIGADGLIIEVHNDPPHAKCDGVQSQTPEMFAETMVKINKIREIL